MFVHRQLFCFFLILFPHQSLIQLLPPVVVSFTQPLTKRCVCVGRTSCLCRRKGNVTSVAKGKTMSNGAATRRRTYPDCESVRRKEKDQVGEGDIYLGCLSATARPRVWRAGWRTEGCGETPCDRNWGCSRNQRLHNLEGEEWNKGSNGRLSLRVVNVRDWFCIRKALFTSKVVFPPYLSSTSENYVCKTNPNTLKWKITGRARWLYALTEAREG